MKEIKVPTHEMLINPVFQALKNLGGSGTNEEINNKVIEMENISDEVLSVIQKGYASKSAVVYRLEWARTYLKKYGAINNTQRGIWSINNEFDKIDSVNEKIVVKTVRTEKVERNHNDETDVVSEGANELKEIKNKLHSKLLKMNPYDFEKLCGILLREVGFSKLEITKKSGDGGIDGYGYLKLNDFFSFKIAFQCKRYTNNVTADEIRDFRGGMASDISNGIFITTSDFTKDAKEESVAIGKQHIDLINGDKLIDKLIELKLGIKEEQIVDDVFFSNI